MQVHVATLSSIQLQYNVSVAPLEKSVPDSCSESQKPPNKLSTPRDVSDVRAEITTQRLCLIVEKHMFTINVLDRIS